LLEGGKVSAKLETARAAALKKRYELASSKKHCFLKLSACKRVLRTPAIYGLLVQQNEHFTVQPGQVSITRRSAAKTGRFGTEYLFSNQSIENTTFATYSLYFAP
jgi:hypothetical protein